MKANGILFSFFMTLLSAGWFSVFGQNDSLARLQSGKMIFQTNCGHCHGVHKEILGPMLGSITKKKSKAWLIRFITDSQEVIASGDAYANLLAEKYHHTVMPCFDQFPPSAIENLLMYLEEESMHPAEKMVVDDKNYDVYVRPDILRGRQLFQDQCASCHSITKEGYGPALGSVTKRHKQAWLIAFIHNSQNVIKTGDPYAIDLFKRFDNRIMVSMEFLKEEDVRDILQYIEFTSSSPSFMGGSNGLKLPDAFHAGVEKPVKPIDDSEEKGFFRVLFIVVAFAGITLLGYVITRFYQFLTNGAQE